MNKILYISVAAILFFLMTAEADARKQYRIGVFFLYESANNDMAFDGVKEGFKTAGIDYEFDIQRADNDEDKADKIIENWIKNKPDLIYTMGTTSTKKIMEEINDTPIVFTAVTNPVQTGIVPGWETSGRNIAGNSNWIPTENILRYFKNVLPSLKTLGVTYDPDNPVSSVEVREAGKVLASIGLKLVAIEIKSVDELTAAVRSLVNRKVDAIWICIDKLTYKNMDKIKAITVPSKIPLLASSHRGLKEGAIAGMTVDYYKLGEISVAIALRILTENVAPKDISIWIMRTYKHIINLKAAQEIDHEIPLKNIKNADEIIK